MSQITYGPTRTKVRQFVFVQGLNQYQTAKVLGISRQRVSVHVAEILKREPGLREEQEASA